MKIIGWILIITGILSIFSRGVSLTFEGLCAVSVPIIGGIILIAKASNKK